MSKGDQKIYLLEVLKPGVVRVLDMRGVDNSLMDKLFEEVRRKVLGYNYLNLILDDWQRVFQKEEEIKLKTTHEFVESQVAKAVVGQTIY